MKTLLLVVALCVIGCSKESESELAALTAQNIYLKVSLGDIPDSTGKEHFRKLSQSTTEKVDKLLNEKLRKLELDSHDPKKHYDSNCRHSLGSCNIKGDIETISKTILYMYTARNW